MSTAQRTPQNALGIVLAVALGISGCGTPSAPLPPSLNLPDRVTDLSAVRTGNQVALTWTMPRRNTDKIPIKTNIPVRVCRTDAANTCVTAGSMEFAPGSSASFSETLSPALSAGTPRPLHYFVELKNRIGRSAGLSDPATMLAGQAPDPVAGLAAEVRKTGVVLHWTPGNPTAPVRLRRTLLSPPPAKTEKNPLAEPPEPVDQTFFIQPQAAVPDRALDKTITFGQTYEYRAQRLVRVEVDGHTLELASELSPPVRVEAADVFPPAVPTGLAAVATAPDPTSGTEASIDLSWQPDTETDLSGYNVYRR